MQYNANRRAVLTAGLGTLGGLCTESRSIAAAKTTLLFPRDHNVHPIFLWETWQLAGMAKAGQEEFGFQVTFFRSQAGGGRRWQAHASITDVSGARYWHGQRANDGDAKSSAVTGNPMTAKLSIGDWSLTIGSRETSASVNTDAFSLALSMTPLQPVLLHGEAGLLRQGPADDQVSYQYSMPQAAVQGALVLQGRRLSIQGDAWLNHEWSPNPLNPQAVGWDRFTMNLFDGSFVDAYQLRDKSGDRLWDGGIFRTGKGQRFEFRRGSVEFRRQKSWKSLLTQANYPVEWIVRTPADFYTVRAVLHQQELDSRPATDGVYWKGLSDLLDSNGHHIGRGLLEMTGYAQAKSL